MGKPPSKNDHMQKLISIVAELMTIHEAAEHHGVAEATVWHWIKTGLIESVTKGNQHLLLRNEVQDFKIPARGRPKKIPV